MTLPNSHLLCGERRTGEGKGEEKGRVTGLCEAEPKNIMARQKMIYSMNVGSTGRSSGRY